MNELSQPVAGIDSAARVPTPGGWCELGEVQRGDEVFAADGSPCRVTAVTDRLAPEGALELRLCDGAVLSCGAAQPWLVEADGELQLLAAAEIAAALREGASPRCSLALAAPFAHPSAELAVEPYELGARLGAGLLEEASGIPRRYLRGDVAQRRELLMGLLDEGGGVAQGGSVYFDTVHQRLALDVCELLRALGHRVTLSNGGGARRSYRRVSFHTTEEVFGLRAPAELLRSRAPAEVADRRWIVDVAELGLRPLRCVAVDAPSHLFVAGDGAFIVADASMAASVGSDVQRGIKSADEVLA